MSHNERSFEIYCVGTEWPKMEKLQHPQLSCFFPDDSVCEQLEYGQGEGQILIDGIEWGFYYNSRGNLDVVLHENRITEKHAKKIVTGICSVLERKQGGVFKFRQNEDK